MRGKTALGGWVAAGLVLVAGLFVAALTGLTGLTGLAGLTGLTGSTAPAGPAKAAEAAKAAGDAATVRTLTYNVCGAAACQSPKQLHEWAGGLVREIDSPAGKADVVALQEMCRGQYDELRRVLPGYAGVWTSTQKATGCAKWPGAGGDTSFGQALLIKGHQSSVTGMSAVVTPADPVRMTAARSLVCAKAPVGGRTVLACGAHLAQDPATQSGTPVLMRSIGDWAAGLPVILAGDFNAVPGSEVLKPVLDGLPGFLSLADAAAADPKPTAWDKTKGESGEWGPRIDLTFFSGQDFRDLGSTAEDIGLTHHDHKLVRSTAVFTERPHAEGDLTGDGSPDLLAVQDDGSLRLYPGLGDGRFAPYRVIGTGGFAGADVSHRGDWNGDGREDVIARIGDELWIYPNSGDGRLGDRIPMGGRPDKWTGITVLAAGDVNGDGQPDLVARGVGGLFLHVGATGTDPGLPHKAEPLAGAEWQDDEILTPGDVNGDGRADLWARSADGRISQFLSAGAAPLPRPTVIGTAPVASYPLAGTIGDANRDGRADLLLTTLTTGPQGTGTGTGTGGLNYLQGNAAGTGFTAGVPVADGGWRGTRSVR
ncbi:FG-GAP-like repeat-containing protein [Streptomyces sp. NBC_00096]|uniref:FG-GAP-like repeat-containing protein n=1 Tax=Streptomyces sp. NBC_00096 TaxID=2975650 RepID=UPI00325341B2